MSALECSCPKCSRRFVPWRVWAITRWSCIQCPACGVALNRRLDWRLLLLCVVSSTLQLFATLAVFRLSDSLPVRILLALASLLAVLILVWLIDLVTVRLVVAGEKRGLFGYKV